VTIENEDIRLAHVYWEIGEWGRAQREHVRRSNSPTNEMKA